MRVLIVITLLFGCIILCQGLNCWVCNSARSYEKCETEGRMATCFSNQRACETVVRRGDGDRMEITKQCKQSLACENNQKQNIMSSGSSQQCNNDQVNSVCHCCCFEDGCSTDELCQGNGTAMFQFNNNGQCESIENFPHGNYNCNNEFNTDSTCTFECTDEEYSIYPSGVSSSECRSNGRWLPAKPCCARPCPKYVLLDFATLVYNKHEESQALYIYIMERIGNDTVVADDAAQYSMTYFSGDIIEDNVVFFNDYKTMEELTAVTIAKYRRINSDDGEVNTGKAIRYAVDNMLSVERGARTGLVDQVLSIYTDTNPSDDAIAAAEYARSKGVQIYVFELRMPDSDLDREISLQITGDPDHVFEVNLADGEKEVMRFLLDLTEHFCQDPCKHVLHDHE